MRRPRAARSRVERSAFAESRFPSEVITVAVRWYLRYGVSYRDLEKLLAARGVEVDHVTVYRWVQRLTPLFTDAARRGQDGRPIGGSPDERGPAGGQSSEPPGTSLIGDSREGLPVRCIQLEQRRYMALRGRPAAGVPGRDHRASDRSLGRASPP